MIEHGNFVSYFDIGRLEDAITDIIQMMNFSISKRELTIKFDKSSLRMSPVIKFDKRRLQQVLLNLLSNACKCQMSGEIKVSAFCSQTNDSNSLLNKGLYINVTVQDKGIGMSPEKL